MKKHGRLSLEGSSQAPMVEAEPEGKCIAAHVVRHKRDLIGGKVILYDTNKRIKDNMS